LITRVRDLADGEAWVEFYDLYAPMLFRYARARSLGVADAEEVRDRCLDAVARAMPDFRYDPERGSFKGWLFAIANAKTSDLLRMHRPHRLSTVEALSVADAAPDPAAAWENAWRHQHMRHGLERARARVSTRNYRAFAMLLDGCSVGEVCEALDMNHNQVYKAKHRVLAEVRACLARLGDDG
jgi:RNA polymerase sigma-70 factor (ECF subfamily)